MSITKISYRTHAWTKFVHQYLVDGVGGGYEEYRRILKEEGGLERLISMWKVFIDEQYTNGWLSEDQYNKYSTKLPTKLGALKRLRQDQGEPTGLPSGNPNYIMGNQYWKDRKAEKLKRGELE